MTFVGHVVVWIVIAAISEVVSQEKSKSSIFDNKPIRVQDYGTPPATSTIPLYDCSGSHRPKADIPGAFEVYHDKQWYLQACQDGLVWNQTLCRCEFPNGNRQVVQCRDYRATGSDPSGKYEQLVNSQWIVRDCSLAVAGLVWDQEACQCVWGPGSKEMITGQGIAPCEIMLNITFEDGVKDEAKGSFVEIGRGNPVTIIAVSKIGTPDGHKAAYFTETALNIWYFAGNELGTSLRVEFRFKMTNDPVQRDKYQIFLSNGCNVSSPGYNTPSLAIGYRAADQSYLLAFETTSARKAIVCTRKLGTYDWHTVSLIYEDGTLLFRVDDNPCIISQDFTGPIQKTPCPLTIGADPLERESMYKGFLDNILIARYCRRFMDTDISELTDKAKGPMPVETALNVVDTRLQQGKQSGSGASVGKAAKSKRHVTSTKYFSQLPSLATSQYSDRTDKEREFVRNPRALGKTSGSESTFRRSVNQNGNSYGYNQEQRLGQDQRKKQNEQSRHWRDDRRTVGLVPVQSNNDKSSEPTLDDSYSDNVGGQKTGTWKSDDSVDFDDDLEDVGKSRKNDNGDDNLRKNDEFDNGKNRRNDNGDDKLRKNDEFDNGKNRRNDNGDDNLRKNDEFDNGKNRRNDNRDDNLRNNDEFDNSKSRKNDNGDDNLRKNDEFGNGKSRKNDNGDDNLRKNDESDSGKSRKNDNGDDNLRKNDESDTDKGLSQRGSEKDGDYTSTVFIDVSGNSDNSGNKNEQNVDHKTRDKGNRYNNNDSDDSTQHRNFKETNNEFINTEHNSRSWDKFDSPETAKSKNGESTVKSQRKGNSHVNTRLHVDTFENSEKVRDDERNFENSRRTDEDDKSSRNTGIDIPENVPKNKQTLPVYSSNSKTHKNEDRGGNFGSSGKKENINSGKSNGYFNNNDNSGPVSDNPGPGKRGQSVQGRVSGFKDDDVVNDNDDETVDDLDTDTDEDVENEDNQKAKQQNERSENIQNKENINRKNTDYQSGGNGEYERPKNTEQERTKNRDSQAGQSKKYREGQNNEHVNGRSKEPESDQNKQNDNGQNKEPPNRQSNKIYQTGNNRDHQTQQNKKYGSGQNNEYDIRQSNRYASSERSKRSDSSKTTQQNDNWQPYKGNVNNKQITQIENDGNKHNRKADNFDQFDRNEKLASNIFSTTQKNTETKITIHPTSRDASNSKKTLPENRSRKGNINIEPLDRDEADTMMSSHAKDKDVKKANDNNGKLDTDKSLVADVRTESTTIGLRREINPIYIVTTGNLVKGNRRFGSKKMNWYDKVDLSPENKEQPLKSDKMDKRTGKFSTGPSVAEPGSLTTTDLGLRDEITAQTQASSSHNNGKSSTNSESKDDTRRVRSNKDHTLKQVLHRKRTEFGRPSAGGYVIKQIDANDKADYGSNDKADYGSNDKADYGSNVHEITESHIRKQHSSSLDERTKGAKGEAYTNSKKDKVNRSIEESSVATQTSSKVKSKSEKAHDSKPDTYLNDKNNLQSQAKTSVSPMATTRNNPQFDQRGTRIVSDSSRLDQFPRATESSHPISDTSVKTATGGKPLSGRHDMPVDVTKIKTWKLSNHSGGTTDDADAVSSPPVVSSRATPEEKAKV